MATKHTPGPWSSSRYLPREGCAYIYAGDHRARIAKVEFGLNYGQDIDAETEANALLIAAADKLLAALLAMIPSNVALGNDAWPDSTVVPIEFTLGELRAARAAIAQATGTPAEPSAIADEYLSAEVGHG